ncbi:MAG: methionine ABC transporter ATP-binding protein [Bacillota bacterium]
MIEIKNLTKIFTSSDESKTVTALKNINLTIEDGEIYGIIGTSGAGKSTLVRCINLLEKPTSGQVLIDGKDLTKLTASEMRQERQKIGMIFQHFNLLWSRTVSGNIAFPLEIAGCPKQEMDKRVGELLELVGLTDKADAYPSQLSGGQKQRVGIARALANHPKVLLSDEATSALDPETTASILELLKTINKELGVTIVVITHEMSVIKEICDRVSVIEKAEIVETGTTVELFTNPRTDIARRFINSVLKTSLPAGFDEKVLSGLLVRLTFIGESAEKPVLSQLVRKFDVDANVLLGSIDNLKDTTFGTLTVELQGNESSIKQGIDFLKDKGIKVEVIQG